MKQQRCKATTAKDNKPCPWSAQKGSEYCGHHLPKREDGKEPWEVLHLPTPDVNKLRKRVVTKLRTRLRLLDRAGAGGGGGGGGGTIYIYFLAKERGQDLWKIGFTTRNVDERMLEWADMHDTTVILKRAYPVAHSAALKEKIIFGYLDYCRLHRYPIESDKSVMRSVWHATGKVLHDVTEGQFVAKHKHTEWFQAPLTTLVHIVEHVAQEKVPLF